jgi:hypothetical protein
MKRKLHLVSRRIAGVDCDRPEVTLWVRTRYDGFARVRFIVDTAADFTAFPISLAEREGIDFPRSESTRGTARGLVGAVEKYLGSFHVRLADEEFDWPCDFLMPPASSTLETPGQRLARTSPVLGRAGFLVAFAIHIDGDYLTIVRRWGSRPLWYRLWEKLQPAREHPVTEPL